MKVDQSLLDRATALAALNPELGTPAGSSPFTQQQMEALSRLNMSVGDVGTQRIRVSSDTPCNVPVEMDCPIVQFTTRTISFIVPNGGLMMIPR